MNNNNIVEKANKEILKIVEENEEKNQEFQNLIIKYFKFHEENQKNNIEKAFKKGCLLFNKTKQTRIEELIKLKKDLSDENDSLNETKLENEIKINFYENLTNISKTEIILALKNRKNIDNVNNPNFLKTNMFIKKALSFKIN